MKEANLKLFVWEGVLRIYGTGMMFALASSVEEARAALLAKDESIPTKDLAKKPKIYDNVPCAYAIWGSF